ncbi:2-methoxy-6-polyprenyl-1,4-benzoquinol methylase, mitochondrial isoform X1 [Saccopteryx bilineata]|uniref:2-methoxy-6-polyprenyl-1,4-benzoquinol methylase, mitochondrial isoform X1 n=1 Tax=Saccopteryx bilineata TaxID=59482 RepID=UPI00338F0724
MAAPMSRAVWGYCGRGWSRVMRLGQLLGLRSSWPGSPLGARLLSQEKRAAETHFGFETVSEEEKGSKVYQVFESVAKKYDVMNDAMTLGIHRFWKDFLLWKMHPFPGTQLVDVAGGTERRERERQRERRGEELEASTPICALTRQAQGFEPATSAFPGRRFIHCTTTGDIAFRFLNYVQTQHRRKQKRQLRAQQNLSWEEIAQKYQNEEDSLHSSHVVVCDINKEMLKIGKQKAYAQGYKTGLAWVLGDAEELPFDDDKFDVYTIAFGIRNVTHMDRALQEAHRVLKPGGQFLCLEFSQVNNPLVSRLYDLYSFQVIPVLGEVIAGDWKAYQYLVESIRRFPSQEEFKEMIEDAGFQKVTYENLTSGIVAVHSGFKL